VAKKVSGRKVGTKPNTLTELFEKAGPCVFGFISKLSRLPKGSPPLYPEIFGTGFLVDAGGIAVTNRHVVDAFDRIPKHPQTGESGLAAILCLAGEDRKSCQMLVVDVRKSCVLGEFTSSDRWHGLNVPDLGFVQLGVRDVQFLRLASENFYLKIGMEIATIGYPMGTLPLTALGKVNQVTPFLRRGIVSSIFPFPIANPHGFTIDVMQQGGSSGSPIFRVGDGAVVGMMSSSVPEWNIAKSDQASLLYSQNTNISVCEPAGIIKKALDEFRNSVFTSTENLPTLAELRAKHPLPSIPDDLTWEAWPAP
jgi:S1-C subfamily serine protease